MEEVSAILWDIDGTLLRANGAGVRAFKDALMNVTGLPYPTARLDMGGRTDPDIATTILTACGIDDPTVVWALLAEVERIYTERVDEFRSLTSALPGVDAVLLALDVLAARQTIVTGNIEPVARHKLAAVDLADRLALHHGAYGSDHRDRAELVALARRRLTVDAGEVADHRTWVIGDTPRDFACAQANGIRCLLVATGTFPIDVLAELGADAVVADLSATDHILEIILD